MPFVIDLESDPLYRKGELKGMQNATLENAIIMIEKFKLSIDDIVKELNIKKEELLEYMKQKQQNC